MTGIDFTNSSLRLSLALVLLVGCGDDADDGGDKNADGGSMFHNSPSGGTSGDKDDGGMMSIFRDASGDPFVGPQCGNSPFGASQIEVNVLIVLDKSGSMDDTPAGFDADKWSSMKTSLAASLDGVKDRLSLGLQLYPMSGCDMPDGSGIDVDVAPGAEALPSIMAALDGAAPEGGTPTAKALRRALSYYTEGAGASLGGDRFVLLATDGGPNCNEAQQSCGADRCTLNLESTCPVANCCDPEIAGAGAGGGCLDDEETRSAIAALAAAGIDTFVVGIPGSESYGTSLDTFAVAGGRVNPAAPPSYFAVDSAGSGDSGLTGVLSSITTGLITSCRLQLHENPPDAGKLNVEVEGALVPKPGADGWDLDKTTDPWTVELKGETCQRIERDGVDSVNVVFGCPTVIE